MGYRVCDMASVHHVTMIWHHVTMTWHHVNPATVHTMLETSVLLANVYEPAAPTIPALARTVLERSESWW